MDHTTEMENFFLAYKNTPETWNTNHEGYKNGHERRRAYQKLLVEFRKIKKDGTLDEMKRKIANLRTSYRRELKKVQCSIELGEKEPYVPSLWHFKMFDFLRNQETSTNDRPMPPKKPTGLDKLLEIYPEGKNWRKSQATSDRAVAAHQQHEQHDPLEADTRAAVDEDVPVHPKVDRKKAGVFANAWACMFRELSREQQLFAKQAIDEIMLLGRLNKLSLNYLYRTRRNNLVKPAQIYLPEVDIKTDDFMAEAGDAFPPVDALSDW